MSTITVTTQAEFDALPDSFPEYTYIYIKSDPSIDIEVNRKWNDASVWAWDKSSVEARGNSRVVAYGNSSVVARDNSTVEACGNSSVTACGNSTVTACGNSSVEARGNSTVVARDKSTVTAWDNSRVEACDNSTVEARGNVTTRLMSREANITLYGYANCYVLKKGNVKRCSSTSTIIVPVLPADVSSWLDVEGVRHMKANRDYVVVYKRVSSDFKTQEDTPNETLWSIGTTLQHPNWNPSSGECGEGKYHACSRPYICDVFRSKEGDRYVAIKVNKADMYVWPNADYPHKVAFRKGKVMYECDKTGNKLS